MFYDLYAMNLPIFLPDHEGLQRLLYNSLYRGKLKDIQQSNVTLTWEDFPPSRGDLPHPVSPFDVEYLEARHYWLNSSVYLRSPAVMNFASLPDLLLQVAELDGRRVSRQMQAFNVRCFQETYLLLVMF